MGAMESSIISDEEQTTDLAQAASYMKSLTCRLCSKRYADPKNMPGCGHVFCLTCLSKLAEKSAVSNRIECPLCSKVSVIGPNGVQEFHTNLAILEVIQELDPFGWSKQQQREIPDGNDCYHCRNCRHAESKKCDHCSKYFCETCLLEHHWGVVQHMEGVCLGLEGQLSKMAVEEGLFQQVQQKLKEEEQQLTTLETNSLLERQWQQTISCALSIHKRAMLEEARTIIQGRLALLNKVQMNMVNLESQLGQIMEILELADCQEQYHEYAVSRYWELEKLKSQLLVLEMVRNGSFSSKLKLVTNVPLCLNKPLQLWEMTAELIDRQQFRELAAMDVTLPEIPSQNPMQKDDEFAIGIDFGTCHLRAAVFHNGKIEMVRDESNEAVIPAFITFAANTNDVPVCFGQEAQSAIETRPTNTVYFVKRLLCQGNLYQETFLVDQNDNSSIALHSAADGKQMYVSPEILIAMQLRRLKDLAEKQFGRKVVNAVLSVPAMFTDGQREAMLSAARMAGLAKTRLNSESLLATISYSYERRLANKCVMLVAVFGGGSFEMALVETQAKNHSCEMIRATGNANQGGIDIDHVLVEVALAKLGVERIREDKTTLFRLQKACKKAKTQLRNEKSVANVKVGDYECAITWLDLNEGIKSFLKDALDHLRSVCPKKRRAEITDIILAGGLCRLKAVQDIFFGYFSDCETQPQFHFFTHDEAVARGAALTAANVFGRPSDDPSCGAIDRNPYGIVFTAAKQNDCHSILREANSRVNTAFTFKSAGILFGAAPFLQLMQNCGRISADFGQLKIAKQLQGGADDAATFTFITDENGVASLKCSSGDIELEKREPRKRLYQFQEVEGAKFIDRCRELNSIHEKKACVKKEILAYLHLLESTGQLTAEQLALEENWLSDNQTCDLAGLEANLSRLSAKYSHRLSTNDEESPLR